MNGKDIILRYTINGRNMKRSYPISQFREARARAKALQENGVSVVVSGMPKSITIPVENL